ncbi:MAG: PorP/SprF family type IX secretion system membrane protein [Saprospiraceae bacterium]|nr:PorP/SprF family type IX secretion system membrane protein [Saprospiraceae bacterium]MBK8081970.1 PorP/SprF family type IX secretion system membrane protein [Saprospiraceae bacterium]
MSFRIFLISAVFVLFSDNMIAQDPHFTQFYSNSLQLNPATSGTYSGTYRVSMIYRDQYFQPLEESFKTFAASGDVKLNILDKKSDLKDVISMGLTFMSDRVRIFDFNTNQMLLTFAYHKALDKRYKQTLGIGFQGGILQRAVNYENLTYHDQFNAIDAYSNPTSEFLPPNNKTVPDLSAGLYYSISPSKTTSVHAGFAFQHFTQPNVSFYDDPVIINSDVEKTSKYPSRITFHGGVAIKPNYRIEILPRVIVLQQGKKLTAQLSSLFKIKFTSRTGQYLHLGPLFRFVNNVNGTSLESMAAMLGIERSNFIIGLSYDWGLTSLVRDSRNFSTLELSLVYIGEHDNDTNFCPQF